MNHPSDTDGDSELKPGARHERIDLAGKDWLTVIEAAHYCGVSNSQFRKYAPDYGLMPRKFMGKQLYEKAALYNAIYNSPQWHSSTTTGAKAANGPAAVSDGSAARRLSAYEARRKRS